MVQAATCLSEELRAQLEQRGEELQRAIVDSIQVVASLIEVTKESEQSCDEVRAQVSQQEKYIVRLSRGAEATTGAEAPTSEQPIAKDAWQDGCYATLASQAAEETDYVQEATRVSEERTQLEQRNEELRREKADSNQVVASLSEVA